MKKALIILGRYPHPGKVKTRLSKDLGNEVTAKFYKNLLEKLLKDVKSLKDIKSFFCYSDINDKQLVTSWLKDVSLINPISNNIDQNLNNAFEKLFNQGFTSVISIASDVPAIDSKLINKAFDNLINNDIVIGPDKDGGIYLFGSKKTYPEFFQIEFKKGEKIFDKTIENIKTKNLNFFVLEKLLDIDTIDDFNIWKNTEPDIEYTQTTNYNT